MAEIYLGKVIGEDGFQRLCAIKRILPHFAQDQEFIQMFRDEAHICKRLQHANIVKVEGFEEVEGSYAIIMEFVDGADLRSLLHSVEQSKQKLSVPFSCYIIAEAARGLHYAHTKVDEITQLPLGIVHRDISPQNILVSYDGEVKVTDFGIADAESKITETRPGIVKGKYSYMSPEQISAKEVDARTDVFALSIVLWEMLGMKRLFQGESEVDTIQRVKNCVITQELRELNPEVDQDLDEIIKKGLAKDPKKRYKSAADFEKDLRRYMSRKFPDFTSEELGSFLKKLMEVKRNESALDIKKTLTETNLKPGKKRQSASASELSGKSPLHGTEDQLPQAAFSLVKSAKALASSQILVGQSSLQKGSLPVIVGTKTNGNLRPTPMKIKKSKWPSMWVIAIGLVLILLLVKVLQPTFVSTKPAQLTIRSQPSRVRILVNQSYVNQGKYLRASSQYPLRLNLKPGKHSVVISRIGYHPYKLELDLEEGDKVVKDDIVLKERATLAALKIRTKSENTYLINIEDGFFVAQLSPPATNSIAPDVTVGRSYRMRIMDSVSKEQFACRFTARATQWRQPNELMIDPEKKRCVMTGP